MTERFVIASMLLTSDARLEITESEFESIIQAVGGFLHCVDAEEKFDNLIENYREFEKFILDESFQSLFEVTTDDVAFQMPRSTASRKLSNFLSSVRLYEDTIGRHAKAILNDDGASTKIKSVASHQYDTSLSYRILEAMRNHAQHHALPVHGYSVNRRWDRESKLSYHEFAPHICVSELAENSEFKKEVLREIIDGPDSLKLKPMVREYVECLSTMHQEFRKMTQTTIDENLNTINETKQRLANEFPDNRDIAIAIYKADEDGFKIGVETNLSNALSDYLRFLRGKNRHLINFARRRISY